MPLGPGVKYRYAPGGKVRLAFSPNGKVIEAKNMQTGDTHTPSEFEADAQRRVKARRAVGGKG